MSLSIDPILRPQTLETGNADIRRIVIDPGHGGKDPGTRGPTGLKESELNLKVSLAVSQLLQDKNISTLLTRTGDYYIELNERIALADAANAAAFISIATVVSALLNPVLGRTVHWTFMAVLMPSLSALFTAAVENRWV